MVGENSSQRALGGGQEDWNVINRQTDSFGRRIEEEGFASNTPV